MSTLDTIPVGVVVWSGVGWRFTSCTKKIDAAGIAGIIASFYR